MEHEPSYRPSSETFAAYFSGESSPEEKQAVDQWANTSEDYQEELEQLRRVWMDVGTLQNRDIQLDLDAAFDQVKQRKVELSVETKEFYIWRAAAAVILLITVSWWFWKPSPTPVVFRAMEVSQINLEDGSVVTLNRSGVLTYPEAFDNKIREIALTGEAFFDVEEDPERPFRVKAGDVSITVLGTSFNVVAQPDQVEVAVTEGRVEVQSDFVEKVLHAGDRITVNLENGTAISGTNSSSGAELYWLAQKLTFEGDELSKVLSEIEDLFEVEIEVSDQTILNCRLQATFEGQSLEEILEIIGLSQDLEISGSDNTYLLSGEGCAN